MSRPTLVLHNRSGAPGALKPAEFDRALGAAADCVLENRPKPLIEAATLGEPAIRRCNPVQGRDRQAGAGGVRPVRRRHARPVRPDVQAMSGLFGRKSGAALTEAAPALRPSRSR